MRCVFIVLRMCEIWYELLLLVILSRTYVYVHYSFIQLKTCLTQTLFFLLNQDRNLLYALNLLKEIFQ